MFRRGSIVCVVLALAVIAPRAQAAAGSWLIAVHGGAAVPTGDFSAEDQLDARAGAMIGGAVDYLLNEYFALGVDGSWNKNKHGAEGETITEGSVTFTLDEDRFTTIQFGAHGKYMFPMGASPIHPYGLGGLGVYSTKEKWKGTLSSGGAISGDETFDSRFGGKVGLGAMYNLNSMWGIGVEGDYNFISEDKDKVGVSSLQYIGVHGAVAFHVMPAK